MRLINDNEQIMSNSVISLDAPNSGIVSFKNGKIMQYRNERVEFRAEFNESFPQFNFTFWKMDDQDLTDSRFVTFLPKMVLCLLIFK